MRRIVTCWLAVLLAVGSIGCSEQSSNKKVSYEINTVVDNTSFAGQFAYPELTDIDNFETVNSLIIQETNSQINGILEGVSSEVSFDFGHTVTFYSNEFVCVLFEGTLYDQEAAHPTAAAFSICVSLTEERIVDPSTLFELNDAFIGAMREQLSVNQNQARFTDEQWKMVAAYIDSYSSEEIAEFLLADPSKTLAIGTDGVIVLFPAPHAIGDYVKVFVPFQLNGL